MTTLFVLDVEDFRPLAEVASKDPDLAVRRRGPYFVVTGPGAIAIDRDATGTRNAVWFSSVAAVVGGQIATWGKTKLVIEPTASPA